MAPRLGRMLAEEEEAEGFGIVMVPDNRKREGGRKSIQYVECIVAGHITAVCRCPLVSLQIDVNLHQNAI